MTESSLRPRAKTAHVNMMTDTVIGNLPADLLRSIVRAVLTVEPSITPILEDATRTCLRKTASTFTSDLFVRGTDGYSATPAFTLLQQRVRAMMGCGMVYESLPLLQTVVDQANDVLPAEASNFSLTFLQNLSSIDADMVQALTAVQKTLLSTTGSRDLTAEEHAPLETLLASLRQAEKHWSAAGLDAPFERSAATLASLLGSFDDQIEAAVPTKRQLERSDVKLDTFRIGQTSVPRLFSGLWQLSSPSWGFATAKQMSVDFNDYVSHGFTAFDMADHYGDAEVIFGRLRASYDRPEDVFGATKYCIFHPIKVTPEVVQANVAERCWRMASTSIDLLQFHWQDYSDRQYIEALRLLKEDARVCHLGLCNFDTEHMKEVLDSGVEIATNQVQFSLIDARPRFRMNALCESSGVKLLTYGTLCGGFLAAKWLDQPEPSLFGPDMTPSQRKYLEMILAWGDWALFQVLLRTLHQIGTKHQVTVSNVATRWVLDFPSVGAVLIGARLGVSQHAVENLQAYGWTLDDDDRAQIEAVLERSRRREMFESMGDCGSEYR